MAPEISGSKSLAFLPVAVIAFVVDQLNLGNPDVAVCARPFFDGRSSFERSANGRILLELISQKMADRAYVGTIGGESIAHSHREITRCLGFLFRDSGQAQVFLVTSSCGKGALFPSTRMI